MSKKTGWFFTAISWCLLMSTHAGCQQSTININTQLVTKGLVSPVGMAVAHDGSNRLFILEQSGKIRIIKNGVLQEVPFLDITKKIDRLSLAYSEKGLLGLAFHPEYKTNGRFFIYYSSPYRDASFDHISVLSEFKVQANNRDAADPSSERIVMVIPEPESNHNGGCIEFGPDGMLYIGPGDGGGAGDSHGTKGNGQDMNSLLGKMLRIDVNGKVPYEIPKDNPFIGKNAKPEIWACGLRNPWRFSFDRETGKLFCGDVGQNKFEEVSIVEKGKNYGWRIMEGTHCYDPESGCNQDGLSLPIYEYPHSFGISVTGGYVYHGKIISLKDKYLAGDWNGKLFLLKQEKDGSWNSLPITVNGKKSVDIGAKINSFGEDEHGEIYIITQHLFGPKSPTGAIYKVVE